MGIYYKKWHLIGLPIGFLIGVFIAYFLTISGIINSIIPILFGWLLGMFSLYYTNALAESREEKKKFSELLGALNQLLLISKRWLNSKAKEKYNVFREQLRPVYDNFTRLFSTCGYPKFERIKLHLIEIDSRIYALIYESLNEKEFKKKLAETLVIMDNIRREL